MGGRGEGVQVRATGWGLRRTVKKGIQRGGTKGIVRGSDGYGGRMDKKWV